MFNKEFVVPIEMFSLQHILSLIVVGLIIFVVFLCRNFFIKNKLADKIFRYTLASLMLLSEMIYYVYAEYIYRDSFAAMLPTPLCGHVLWIISIALYADSKRIVKLFYPLAMTGGTLSLIFLNMEASFPHFRAFHYYIVHAGFMLAVLYFFFTRKIITYKLKDLGWSCFTLLAMGSIMFIFSALHLEDSYFIMCPPPGLESTKEVLGQTGYTIVYILAIALIMGIYALLLNLGTRKRDVNTLNITSYQENKVLNKMAKLSNGQTILIIFLPIIAFIYITVLEYVTSSNVLYAICVILYFAIIINLIINEIKVDYINYYKSH